MIYFNAKREENLPNKNIEKIKDHETYGRFVFLFDAKNKRGYHLSCYKSVHHNLGWISIFINDL